MFHSKATADDQLNGGASKRCTKQTATRSEVKEKNKKTTPEKVFAEACDASKQLISGADIFDIEACINHMRLHNKCRLGADYLS